MQRSWACKTCHDFESHYEMAPQAIFNARPRRPPMPPTITATAGVDSSASASPYFGHFRACCELRTCRQYRPFLSMMPYHGQALPARGVPVFAALADIERAKEEAFPAAPRHATYSLYSYTPCYRQKDLHFEAYARDMSACRRRTSRHAASVYGRWPHLVRRHCEGLLTHSCWSPST